jgi:hypothetical protein
MLFCRRVVTIDSDGLLLKQRHHFRREQLQ